MAPEQLYGGESGTGGDLYSLGTVLYECLAGSLPFLGTQRELIEKKGLYPAPGLPDCPYIDDPEQLRCQHLEVNFVTI